MQVKKSNALDKLSDIVFKWIAVGIGAIAVLCMFLPALLKTKDLGVPTNSVVNSTKLFFQEFDNGAGWPIFVGYMLLVIAVLLTAFTALPFAKNAKKFLIIAIVCFVIGALIIFFTKPIYLGMKGRNPSTWYLNPSHAGPYVVGSLSILAGGLDVVALKISD